MAAHAGTDVLYSTLADLVDDVGVSQQGATKADHVGLTLENGSRGDVGIVHAACGNDGNGKHFLQFCIEGEVDSLTQIHGGMAPIVGIVAAHIGIEGIVAGLLQDLGSCQALFHIAAYFVEHLAGQCAIAEGLHHVFGRVAQHHREVLSASPLDTLQYLNGQLQTTLQGAAVFIITLVKAGHGELIHQIALMDSVDVHAVKACGLCHGGSTYNATNQVLDLLGGEGTAGDAGIPTVGICRGGDQLTTLLAPCGTIDASAAGSQLQEDLGIVGVDALGHQRCLADKLGGVEVGTGIHTGQETFQFILHYGKTRLNEADTATGTGEIILHAVTVIRTRGLGHAAGTHRCHGEAVFDLHFADFDRVK